MYFLFCMFFFSQNPSNLLHHYSLMQESLEKNSGVGRSLYKGNVIFNQTILEMFIRL